MNNQIKILIIDDNQVAREMARMMLEKNGYQVIALSSGITCNETIAAEKPNLVLLDIMMPVLNGKQVLQKIREKYSELQIPVIMVTSQSDTSEVVESLKQGANDYITKPIQFDVALRRIQTQLTLVEISETTKRKTELDAIQAAVRTYNHEINNPLAAAIFVLTMLKKRMTQVEDLADANQLESALWNISELLKKTTLLLEGTSPEYESYVGESKMFKLKGKEG